MDALPVPQQLDQLELVGLSAQFLHRREVVQIRSSGKSQSASLAQVRTSLNQPNTGAIWISRWPADATVCALSTEVRQAGR